MRQGLVVWRKVLGEGGTGSGEVVGRQRRGRGRGHRVTWRVGGQWRVEGVGNEKFALWRRLSRKLGGSMGMRAGRGGLMMQCQRAI